MSRFTVGKGKSKDLKLGPIKAKQCQEVSNQLDNSVIADKHSK